MGTSIHLQSCHTPISETRFGNGWSFGYLSWIWCLPRCRECHFSLDVLVAQFMDRYTRILFQTCSQTQSSQLWLSWGCESRIRHVSSRDAGLAWILLCDSRQQQQLIGEYIVVVVVDTRLETVVMGQSLSTKWLSSHTDVSAIWRPLQLDQWVASISSCWLRGKEDDVGRRTSLMLHFRSLSHLWDDDHCWNILHEEWHLNSLNSKRMCILL